MVSQQQLSRDAWQQPGSERTESQTLPCTTVIGKEKEHRKTDDKSKCQTKLLENCYILLLYIY